MSVIAYAYNTSTHEATGFSPYELVFGRTARNPIEMDLDMPLKNPCSQSEYSQSVRRSLRSLKQSAQQNLIATRSLQPKYKINILRSGCLSQWAVQCGLVALKPGNLVEGGLDHSGLSLEKG